MLPADLDSLLRDATDYDGLTKGIFDDIEQDWVRVGNTWIRLDSRFPWQLAQCIRQNALLSGCALRLDPKQTEADKEHEHPLRKAYWWGAPFDWGALDRRKRMVTVHGDHESLMQRLNFVAKTRFHWDFPSNEPLAILQIEEFREEPGARENAAFAARYLHSIAHLERRKFVHLDGAIKTYSRDEYVAAYDTAGVKAGRYEKLFRIDETFPIADEVWLAVVASFFEGNDLIREYFGGE